LDLENARNKITRDASLMKKETPGCSESPDFAKIVRIFPWLSNVLQKNNKQNTPKDFQNHFGTA
jgi:hypothetical protein